MNLARRLTTLGIAATILGAIGAGRADDAALRSAVLGIQKDYEAAVAARDRMAGSLDAEWQGLQAGGAGWRATLTLTNGMLRRPVIMKLTRLGDRWVNTVASFPGYSKAECPMDASGLLCSGGSLRGRVKVTIVSDGWVPPPGETYELAFDIDATLRDGSVAGTYRADGNRELSRSVPADQEKYDALRRQIEENPKIAHMLGFMEQLTIHDLPHEDGLAGTVEKVTMKADPPKAPPVVPLEGRSGADLYGEAVRLEGAAEVVYQSARAVDLVRQSSLPYARTLELAVNRCPERPAYDESRAAATVASIGARVARQRSLLEARLEIKEPTRTLVGRVVTGDPDFLGYYGQEPLPSTADKPNQLVTDAGGEGPERWHFVTSWRMVGPMARDKRPDLFTEYLPEVVEAFDAVYAAEDVWVEGRGSHVPPPEFPKGKIKWVESSGVPAVAPTWYSNLGKARAFGAYGTMLYAATEVHSDVERDVYVAVRTDDIGRLWVNDRMVWVGPTITLPLHMAISVFKVHFRQGRNRVLVRCDNDWGNHYFWMKVCVRGGPRTPERMETDRRQQAEARAAIEPRFVRGWRGDGSGVFPEARPATAWDADLAINVLWRIPMKRFSISHPVVVGDRVFTQMDPHTLFCVDKNTGKILWQRDSNIIEFLPEDVRKEALADYEKEAGGKPMSETESNEARSRLKALSDEVHAKLVKKPEDDALLAEAKAVDAKIAELDGARRGIAYWASRLGVHGAGLEGRGWFEHYLGYSSPTPVTDGKHIWVKYGTEVAACYDMDGNRKWMVRTHLSGGANVPNMPSPVLAGKVLVLEGGQSEYWKRSPGKRLSGFGPPMAAGGNHWLIGLDAETGKVLWDVGPVMNSYYGGSSSPIGTRVTNGKDVMDLVVTGWGQVFRGSDGKELIHYIDAMCFYDTPMQFGDIVYFSKPLAAIEFRMQDADTVGAVPLRKDGRTPTGMLHKGLFFVVSDVENGFYQLDAFDAKTGEKTGSTGRLPYALAEQYPTCAVAGDYVFICGCAGIVVATASPRPRWVSYNPVKKMGAAPTFDGDRMYLRTYDSFMCIGLKGDEGRAYEREQWASRIMESFPTELRAAPVRKVTARPGLAALPEDAVIALRDSHTLTFARWLVAGPFPTPQGSDDGTLAAVVDEAAPTAGGSLTIGDVTRKWTAMDPKNVMESGGVDPDGAAFGGEKGDAYFAAVLNNPSPRFLQVSYGVQPEQQEMSVRLWIGGRAVAAKEFVHMPERGRIPVVMRVRKTGGGGLPAALAFMKPTVKVVMEQRNDPNFKTQPEIDRTRADKDILKKVADTWPNADWGQKAARLLRQLENLQ